MIFTTLISLPLSCCDCEPLVIESVHLLHRTTKDSMNIASDRNCSDVVVNLDKACEPKAMTAIILSVLVSPWELQATSRSHSIAKHAKFPVRKPLMSCLLTASRLSHQSRKVNIYHTYSGVDN
ncbi:uncharacterized protein P174DRAFT_60773 [Aspergillus novofumigatus IBT 16806]|uniref:Secreted protein n=1 Tax=Aspergillus novofumigatus (strain IBT 16806) TaxID=1392255 RepID=A0A2I1BU80_ASPN1|nr:uncharacterized protein P174DRAFT_60773 [Aspergillus novofumigatus IBT 16806]PKX88957.1 hypothetical protein P174DRAFT_60773 [Aspergillus novofumigatus IBT 16806]